MLSKKRKINTKIDHSENVYQNAYCPSNNTSVTYLISRYVNLWNTRNWIGPLINEKRYNLTEKTTKTVKFEKYLKMYIVNFKTIPYKLTALGNIIHSIINHKLMRPVSSLRLPKNKNRQKTANSRKKFTEKSVEGIKTEFFTKTFPFLINFLKQWDSSFLSI